MNNISKILCAIGACTFAWTGSVMNNNTSNKIQKPSRWLSHNQDLINTTETYSFETEKGYTAKNPDTRANYPQFSNSVLRSYTTNETIYKLYGTDRTGTILIKSANGFETQNNLAIAEGKCTISVQFQNILPDLCELADDTRTINDTNGYFNNNVQNKRIGKGLLVYRRAENGTYYGWDGAVSLNGANTKVDLSFEPGEPVQIAILYEIHNYDNGWWIFQKHNYYHTVGIYNLNIVK